MRHWTRRAALLGGALPAFSTAHSQMLTSRPRRRNWPERLWGDAQTATFSIAVLALEPNGWVSVWQDGYADLSYPAPTSEEYLGLTIPDSTLDDAVTAGGTEHNARIASHRNLIWPHFGPSYATGQISNTGNLYIHMELRLVRLPDAAQGVSGSPARGTIMMDVVQLRRFARDLTQRSIFVSDPSISYVPDDAINLANMVTHRVRSIVSEVLDNVMTW